MDSRTENPLEHELDLKALEEALDGIGASWQMWKERSSFRPWAIYHALDEYAFHKRLSRKRVLQAFWKAQSNGAPLPLDKWLEGWPGTGAYN